MTIGDLYASIERMLEAGPATAREIYKYLASETDATVFDVVAALRALRDAGQIKQLTEDFADSQFCLPTWPELETTQPAHEPR